MHRGRPIRTRDHVPGLDQDLIISSLKLPRNPLRPNLIGRRVRDKEIPPTGAGRVVWLPYSHGFNYDRADKSSANVPTNANPT
jgi:hypothetical protein